MEDTINQDDVQEEVQLPPVDFVSFTADLITTAHLYLQGFKDPETDKVIVNLNLAKRMIDTIEMLEEKTKGNLTAPESNFLANSLYNLRMDYVRAVNMKQGTSEQEETEEQPKQNISEESTEQNISDNTPEQDDTPEENITTETEKTDNQENSNS